MVSHEHSINLAVELKKYGKTYKLKIYPCEGHLLTGVTEDVIREIQKWMKLPAASCRVSKRNCAEAKPAFALTSYGAVASPFIPVTSYRVFWRKRIKFKLKGHLGSTFFTNKHMLYRSQLIPNQHLRL